MTRRSALATAALAALAGAVVATGGLRHLSADQKPEHPIPEPLKQPLPTSFECRWTDSAITLDGVADEPAWKHAQPIAAFHLPWLGDKARMGRTAATAKLLWDREYLYFHCEMEDSDLFADITAHDGELWKNDVFEIFLRPDATRAGYYEFQVNAAGAHFDAFYPKYDVTSGVEWSKVGQFHMESKVKLRGTLNKRDDTDKGWSVEGRISWTDFVRTGGRPVPGEKWKLNLCRYDYHADWKEPELSCVAPIAKKKIPSFFHQSEDYATLAFVGPDATTAKPFGIDKLERPTSSTVVGFPDPPPSFIAARALDKYRPEFPVYAELIPGGGTRGAPLPGDPEMLVITQPWAYGPTAVSRIKYGAATATKDAVKLMDTPSEGTAYGLTFHPKFAENGYVYIGWNGKLPGKPGKWSVITRYAMTTKAPHELDLKSAANIIEWASDGHNGAAVCFGGDGMMYVTSGDGTSDSDTNLTGQRTDLLLAKLLRIDVDKPADGKMYSVPKDNPFVGNKDFRPETWAMGLRNPWRISYDAKTKQLWVGQNGQDLWEQAYLVKKGDNYGWSVMEGGHPFYPNRKAGPTPFAPPTVEHHHSEARSLTGGLVYHGAKYPELQGAYIYGDYSTGHIWAVKHTGDKIEWHKKIAITTLKITGFTTDPNGELLITHHAASGDGGLFTLVPNTAKHDARFPKKLSDSGLFDSVKEHKLKPGVIPYSVNAPFWSDGLHKARFLAVPEGTIQYKRTNGWDFPDKTVVVKSFALETTEGDPTSRKWVETRFMTRQAGEWYGYSYIWTDDGTDATLVAASGTDREFVVKTAGGERKQAWHYPSRAECMVCHSRAANYVLGLCEVQFNKDHTYPSGRTDNQLRVLEHLGLFNVGWAGEVGGAITDATSKQQPDQREPKPTGLLHAAPAALKRLADPYDKAQPLDLRAKAWLHTNCATCHVEAGGGNAQMQLDYPTAWDKMRLIDAKPLHQTFGLADARLIAPGAPERSVVLQRIRARGPNSGQMPPLSSARIDPVGVELMTEWCKGLKK
ncbi:PQQ-dependent sugar dehydrogenase [Frigoriglobus tundricola]|uniref:Glucose/L-sorbosone dehydrogenase, distantly related to bacterial beta-galactosidase n=1 Tax=Frigoriglobus tundricola TaxID=2774151 RepID=A0A6M5YRU5_9BACT|nr:PQQ-dependent sugar dehydrogenase [Frigoriglobus tundricola]QJW96013.1 glucose/L-sorbosone dehydrogenase, distantly related to bacterial beta-galactosidase [Frigoriglobus tundricola]